MKYCNKCKNTKDKSEFHKNSKSKDGLQAYCKTCRSYQKKLYREKNKERINEVQKEYYQNNKERILSYTKSYYRVNKEKYDKWHKEYRSLESTKRYKREWQRERYRNNNNYRLHSSFSALLRSSLRTCGGKRGLSAFELVPYSFEDFKEHLKGQFDENMSWENYGSYWHIDHIIPRCAFKYSSYSDEEFQRCWSLGNLRPLEAKQNLQKGSKRLVISQGEEINGLVG